MSRPKPYQDLADRPDIPPEAHEAGIRTGTAQPRDTVTSVGAASVGLAAVSRARACAPPLIVRVDLDERRLERRRGLAADATFDDGMRREAHAGG